MFTNSNFLDFHFSWSLFGITKPILYLKNSKKSIDVYFIHDMFPIFI